MDPGERSSSKKARSLKSVRFPEESSRFSTRIDYDHSDGPESTDNEEEGYFSYRPDRPFLRETEDEDDDDDDEVIVSGQFSSSRRQFRERTRANTLHNRHNVSADFDRGVYPERFGSTPPSLQVTPPPAAAGTDVPSQRQGRPGLAVGPSLTTDIMESVLDIGRGSTGLAPGAVEPQNDHDPLDDEYRDRISQHLHPNEARNIGGPRMVVSMPASPLLSASPMPEPASPPQASIGDIPLKELDSKLEQVLRERQQEKSSQPPTPEREVPGRQSQDEKHGPDDFDPRQEARDLAKRLVQAHFSKNGKHDDSGYVRNDQELYGETAPDGQKRPGNGYDRVENDDTNEQARDDLELGMHNVEPPTRVREGVLGSLLRLYAEQDDNKTLADSPSAGTSRAPSYYEGATPAISPSSTPGGSTPGGMTPTASGPGSPRDGKKGRPQFSRMSSTVSSIKLKRPSYFRSHSSEDILGRSKDDRKNRRKWYQETGHHSSSKSGSSLSALAKTSMNAINAPNYGAEKLQSKKDNERRLLARKRRKAKEMAERRITIHIADVLQRQRFILRFGRALMLYGAPSHRLEEYLRMTSKVFEIDAQFLYLPGCMLVSFGDATTHTSETKIIRSVQGLNLTKLDQTHLIYKEVVHDIMGVEEAGERLDSLLRTKNLYPAWLSVLFFGLASACVCLAFFGGKWPDLPMCFVLGTIVGFLQIWAAPRSDLYNNVFEVTSSILCSFLGRALGSITRNGDKVFCFAAITQGALALILPGYIILCGSLELQSKNLVAGAVRMFYAIIYSMFLAFGITLGAAIYGWIDSNASNEFNCAHQLDPKWRILFVPLASVFLAMVNQASLRQLPTMIFIASAGYTVLYFVQTKIVNASSFTSALGAFTIGILGNLYSRLGHGLAFAAMLPGIFVIVPGGIAAQGSLVAGVALANQIVGNSTNRTHSNDQGATAAATAGIFDTSGATSLGGSMVQVAVGITVGLFVATLVVYPLGLGKKRSGLFTF